MWITDLKVTDVEGKPGKFELLEDLVYVSEKYGKFRVRAGFQTDFASVPRWLWSFASPLETRKASTLHDSFYNKETRPEGMRRKLADKIFREAMKAEGVGKFKRNLFYRGVRVGGGCPWNKREEIVDDQVEVTTRES